MQLYQLTSPKDDGWDLMNEFGNAGISHFIDLNKDEQPYQLPYTSQIKSCEDSERKLQYLLDQCKKYFIETKPPEDTEAFMAQVDRIKDNKQKALNLLLEEIQKDINEQAGFVENQNK